VCGSFDAHCSLQPYDHWARWFVNCYVVTFVVFIALLAL